MLEKLEQFVDQKYLNLETFRKNGNGVKTPVWFVVDDDLIYIITRESTGKVKRLADNPIVKLAPCSFNGEVKGKWVSGTAIRVDGAKAKNAISLRKKKYGFKALLASFMTKAKGNLVVYEVVLD